MRVIIFFIIFGFAFNSLAADCGRILAATGSVEVLRTPTKSTDEANPPRVAFPISANDIIRCDDIIQTRERSSAVLLIPRGKLAIGANTKITIAKYSNEAKPDANLIDLFFGHLRSLITKKKTASSSEASQKFQVRTPTAVTGVRGTDFFVSYDEKTKLTEQATLEGQVEVTTAKTTAPVVVSAGEQVSIDSKTETVQVAPINEAVKTKIRSVSVIVQKDADFIEVSAPLKAVAEAVPTKTDVLYKGTRWVLAVGPTNGEVNHASGAFDGDGISGHSLMIERQKQKKQRSLLMAVNLLEVEDDNINESNIRNSLTALSLEGGLRIWHANKWSPYIKAGLGYLRNEAHIFGIRNKWEYAALVGAVGIDGIFKPFIWQTAGIYAAVDGRLNQTLFILDDDTPSNLEDESLNAFFVTLRLGISVEF